MSNLTAAAPSGAAVSISGRAWSSWALDFTLAAAPFSFFVTSISRGTPAHGLLLSALRAPTKLASVFCLLSSVSFGREILRVSEEEEARDERGCSAIERRSPRAVLLSTCE